MTPTIPVEAELLAAVRHLLPVVAADELARWDRGEVSGSEAVRRLRSLGEVPDAPERNGVVTKVGPTDDKLSQQILAFEVGFPPPDEKAILADCRWTQEHWIDDHLAPYRGTHAVVFNGAVVGSGDDSLQLQLDLARKLNVHPQRLVITYIPRGGGLF